MFAFDTRESAPLVAIAITGALDMGYAFCLFWPANLMPMLGLVVIMQLYVPFDTFFGYICCKKKHRKIHILMSVLIIAGGIISYIAMNRLKDGHPHQEVFMRYTNLAIFGQLLNVISH